MLHFFRHGFLTARQQCYEATKKLGFLTAEFAAISSFLITAVKVIFSGGDSQLPDGYKTLSSADCSGSHSLPPLQTRTQSFAPGHRCAGVL